MSGAGKSIRGGIGALALVMGSGIGLIERAAAGADMRPSGPPIRTLDVTPKAGAAACDDAG
jgi:hypothetical protein